jgi:hypothetical protein
MQLNILYVGDNSLSKNSGKGDRRFYLFMTAVITLSVFLAPFLFQFSPSVYINQTSTVPDGCISAAQAYKTAMPHITEYARENGRLIMAIDITFSNSSKDLGGQRGDTTLSYPEWTVSAFFAKDLFGTEHSVEGYPSGVFGYQVSMWADTGEVRDKGAQGFL